MAQGISVPSRSGVVDPLADILHGALPMQPRDRATHAWLQQWLRGVDLRSLPVLGSKEWHALPDPHRQRTTAVIVAAGSWWAESRPERIAERFRDELAVLAQLEAAAFADVAAGVRRLANRPTHSDLVRRWAL